MEVVNEWRSLHIFRGRAARLNSAKAPHPLLIFIENVLASGKQGCFSSEAELHEVRWRNSTVLHQSIRDTEDVLKGTPLSWQAGFQGLVSNLSCPGHRQLRDLQEGGDLQQVPAFAQPASAPPGQATLADGRGERCRTQAAEVSSTATTGGVRVLPGFRGRVKQLLNVYCLCIYCLVDGSCLILHSVARVCCDARTRGPPP